MFKYIAPLGVFLGGNFVLLLVFLFLPAVGDAGDTLAAATSSYASNFWGWDWVVGNVKFWVFFIFEMVILGMTTMAFLKVKR